MQRGQGQRRWRLVAEFEVGTGVDAFHTLRIDRAQQDAQLARRQIADGQAGIGVVAANSRISGVAASTTSTR